MATQLPPKSAHSPDTIRASLAVARGAPGRKEDASRFLLTPPAPPPGTTAAQSSDPPATPAAALVVTGAGLAAAAAAAAGEDVQSGTAMEGFAP